MELTKGHGAAKRDDDHDSDFSLLELLIVILILSVLAAVVVLAIAGLRDDAETAPVPPTSGI